VLERLVAERRRLLVVQQKHWSEILVGYETRNRFELRDESGALLGMALEEGAGVLRWLGRQVFGRCRKATVHLLDPGGGEFARIEKPFRWYFQEATLHEDGRAIGRVARRFSILRDRFSVQDLTGRDLLEIKRGFLDHFRFRGTFRVRLNGLEVALIRKEWRGLLSEWFTDADTFGVEFTESALDVEVRKLLVAAVFLIDFTCFENNQGRGGVLFDLAGD
jgi:uncharacterized protein YxjI